MGRLADTREYFTDGIGNQKIIKTPSGNGARQDTYHISHVKQCNCGIIECKDKVCSQSFNDDITVVTTNQDVKLYKCTNKDEHDVKTITYLDCKFNTVSNVIEKTEKEIKKTPTAASPQNVTLQNPHHQTFYANGKKELETLPLFGSNVEPAKDGKNIHNLFTNLRNQDTTEQMQLAF